MCAHHEGHESHCQGEQRQRAGQAGHGHLGSGMPDQGVHQLGMVVEAMPVPVQVPNVQAPLVQVTAQGIAPAPARCQWIHEGGQLRTTRSPSPSVFGTRARGDPGLRVRIQLQRPARACAALLCALVSLALSEVAVHRPIPLFLLLHYCRGRRSLLVIPWWLFHLLLLQLGGVPFTLRRRRGSGLFGGI